MAQRTQCEEPQDVRRACGHEITQRSLWDLLTLVPMRSSLKGRWGSADH